MISDLMSIEVSVSWQSEENASERQLQGDTKENEVAASSPEFP